MDVNCPGSQEDLVGNWEPVYSLVEDASLWGQDCPCILALAVAHLPLCLPASGRGWAGPQLANSPLVFTQSLMQMVVAAMKFKDAYALEGKL